MISSRAELHRLMEKTINTNLRSMEERIEAYRGTVLLPFEARRNGRIAVKIVDDRGIESLKIVEVK